MNIKGLSFFAKKRFSPCNKHVISCVYPYVSAYNDRIKYLFYQKEYEKNDMDTDRPAADGYGRDGTE